MAPLNTVREEDIGADGKLRRKYELHETTGSVMGAKFGFGVLLSNAVMVIKSIFFGGEEETNAASNKSTTDQQTASELVDDSPRVPALKLVHSDEKTKDLPVGELQPSNNDKVPSRFDREILNDNGGRVTVQAAPSNSSAPEPSNVIQLPINPIINFVQGLSGAASGGSGGGGGGVGPSRALDDSENLSDVGVGDEMSDIPVVATDGDDSTPPPSDRTPNRAPGITSSVSLRDLYLNQSVIISMSALLAGAYDPDGDALAVENLAVSVGTVTEVEDGNWRFTPTDGYLGGVTFSYDIVDGEYGVEQEARLELLPIPGDSFFGTDGDDRIIGTPGSDRIEGRDGNDTILARQSSDVIDAGAGDDRVIAGDGDDVIYGGDGNDVIFAGAGNDFVVGGAGDDFLSGQDGDDTLFGEDGDDTILGGDGADSLFGGEGNDDLQGGSGGDLLDGGAGEDKLTGGGGHDILVGGAGDDIGFGSGGDDLFVSFAADGDDIYDGGDGTDTYNLSGTSADAVVDLGAGRAFSGDIGEDQISGIEDIEGGSGNDILIGNSEANKVVGGAGSDYIDGGENDDDIVASVADGDDSYDGGMGTDTYDMSDTTAPATVDLGSGQASSAQTGVDDLANIENVVGSQGDDDITGDDESNEIYGCGGDDEITGGAGSDYGHGGVGNDVFVAHSDDGDDDYEGWDGDDTYDASQTTADATIDLSQGYASSDQIGYDTLHNVENAVGGEGDDVIVANEEQNVLVGGGGFDIFVFLEGNKSGKGGHNRDRIDDFEVGDRIDVSGISGDAEDDGWQRLTFRYDQATFDGAGQVIFRYEDDDGEGFTLLRFNFDDDGYDDDDDEVDFEIEIVGRVEFDDYNLIT